MADITPSSSDFSKEPSYGEINHSFTNQKGEVFHLPKKTQLGRLSQKPYAPGTFSIKNKEGGTIPSLPMQKIIERNNQPKVGMELASKSKKEKDFHKTLLDAGFAIQDNGDGTIGIEVNPELHDQFTKEVRALSPCIAKYAKLETKWEALLPSINLIEDVSVRGAYVDQITTAFSVLSWLASETLDTETPVASINNSLSQLEKLIKELEEIIKHNNKGSLTVTQKKEPIDRKQADLLFDQTNSTLATLQKTLGSAFTENSAYHADFILKQQALVEGLRQAFTEHENEKNYELYQKALEIFKKQLHTLNEKIATTKQESSSFSLPTFDDFQIDVPSLSYENGVWIFHKKEGDVPVQTVFPHFTKIRSTLEAYQRFYTTIKQEAGNHPIEQVILSKNEVLAALLIGDFKTAERRAIGLGNACRLAYGDAKLQQPAPSSEEAPSSSQEQKQEEKAFDLWGGFPKTVVPPSQKGVLWCCIAEDGTKKNLPNTDAWNSIKTNFDVEMALYTAFFKGAFTTKKTTLYRHLIETKEEVVKAIKEATITNDTGRVLALITTLRESLEQASSSWKEEEEKLVLEKETQKKEEEKQRSLRLTFQEQEGEYKKQMGRIEGLVDLISDGRGSIIMLQANDLENDRKTIQEKINAHLTVPEEEFREYIKDLKRLTEALDGISETVKKTYSSKASEAILNAAAKTKKRVVLRKKELTIAEVQSLPGYETYKQMYEKDPDAFRDLFRNKVFVPGDPSKPIIAYLLSDTETKVEEEKIRDAVEGLADQLRLQLLTVKELQEKKNQTESTAEKDVLSIRIENEMKTLRALTDELTTEKELLDTKTRRILHNNEEVSSRSVSGITLAESYRETYSPKNDAESVGYSEQSKGTLTKRLHTFLDRKFAEKRRAAELEKEEELQKNLQAEGFSNEAIVDAVIKERSKGVPLTSKENGMYRSLDEAYASTTPLSSPVTPNKVPITLTDEEAPFVPKPQDEITPLPPKQEEGQERIEPTFEEEEPKQEEGAGEPSLSSEEQAPPSRLLEEKKNLKETSVQKILGTLVAMRAHSWKELAVATLVLGGAVYGGKEVAKKILEKQKQEEVIQKPRTLGQTASWKDFPSLTQEHHALRALLEAKDFNISAFIKRFAPTVTIDPRNPATLQKITAMEVKTLMLEEGDVFGLREEERRELSSIAVLISQLEEAATSDQRTAHLTFTKKDWSQETESFELFIQGARWQIAQANKHEQN